RLVCELSSAPVAFASTVTSNPRLTCCADAVVPTAPQAHTARTQTPSQRRAATSLIDRTPNGKQQNQRGFRVSSSGTSTIFPPRRDGQGAAAENTGVLNQSPFLTLRSHRYNRWNRHRRFPRSGGFQPNGTYSLV